VLGEDWKRGIVVTEGNLLEKGRGPFCGATGGVIFGGGTCEAGWENGVTRTHPENWALGRTSSILFGAKGHDISEKLFRELKRRTGLRERLTARRVATREHASGTRRQGSIEARNRV